MRILYNATSSHVGGGLTFVLAQTAALADRPDVELTVLAATANAAPLEAAVSGRAAVECVRAPHPAARFLWEQTVLPVRARRHDVLVCPGNFCPLLAMVPVVVILQNANYVGSGRRLPQNTGLPRRGKIRLSHWSMRRADAVVAISHALAAEIRREPHLRDAPVVTVQSGAPRPRRADAVDGPAQDLPEGLGAHPYLLSVASDYPHKRLDDLGRLAPLLDLCPSAVPRRIALAGPMGPDRREALRVLAGAHADALVFLGQVDEATLTRLYDGAAATVVTSELESWGLTLNEAGSRGCPVVATDLPAHREVAGDHVRYVPVGDLTALVDAVEAAVAAPRPRPWALDRPWSDNAAELVDAIRPLVAPS